LLDEVRGADVEGRTFGEVVRGLADCDPAAAGPQFCTCSGLVS
jgi:hypothetical protein